ncbi:MAG: NADP-dependent oxidoreductase [Porticoccaceae bacterium]|nr:MAG: NADP-dependent oxidoreductase [Porticoccaceae bacterium]
MTVNRQIVLARYVHGEPREEDFALVEGEVPEPGPGEFVVRNLYFSLEPAIRGWLEGKANYFEPIPLGGVVRAPTVGRVVRSRHPDYREGEIVFGLNRWEDYSLASDETILLEKLHPAPDLPLSYYVGPLGGSGTTAYIGLHEIGRIAPGQTVVVSAAAGATGGMAVQIARLRGCRVIGIVGSDEKARLVTEVFGASAAVNYKTCGDLTAAVRALAPEGVDVYYDNVGGPILDALLLAMKPLGRVVCCGMIADYNRSDDPHPIRNLWEVVSRQLTLQGFLLFTYHDQVPEAQRQLEEWIRSGEIRVREHLTRGIANTPKAFCELMRGVTMGKALVELDRPEED